MRVSVTDVLNAGSRVSARRCTYDDREPIHALDIDLGAFGQAGEVSMQIPAARLSAVADELRAAAAQLDAWSLLAAVPA